MTVVILAEKVPSYLPKLADVKGKVEADYKLSQKRKLFSERASALDKALQSAKDEKSFEKSQGTAARKFPTTKIM